MKEYIFVMKRYNEEGIVERKALYYKDIPLYLNTGWDFSTSEDKKIYKALQNFYTMVKDDTDRRDNE